MSRSKKITEILGPFTIDGYRFCLLVVGEMGGVMRVGVEWHSKSPPPAAVIRKLNDLMASATTKNGIPTIIARDPGGAVEEGAWKSLMRKVFPETAVGNN